MFSFRIAIVFIHCFAKDSIQLFILTFKLFCFSSSSLSTFHQNTYDPEAFKPTSNPVNVFLNLSPNWYYIEILETFLFRFDSWLRVCRIDFNIWFSSNKESIENLWWGFLQMLKLEIWSIKCLYLSSKVKMKEMAEYNLCNTSLEDKNIMVST